MLVQEEIVRRARIETRTGRRRVYSGKYAFSSIVFCAHCGDIYQRTHWIIRGERVHVWRCVSRLQKKSSGIDCLSRTVYEEDLHVAVVKAVNQLIAEKDDLLPAFRANVEKIIGTSNSAEIAEIDEKLVELQKELLKLASAKQDYSDITDQIDTLRDKKQRLLLEDATSEGVRRQMASIDAFLDEQQTAITEFDEELVRRLIEKITIFDDHMIFEFKSGLELDVQA